MSDLVAALRERGLVEAVSDEEGLRRALQERRITLYAGFDPSAESLHIGNLMAILFLMRFQRQGHRPIVVVGGGTGMIGDPSGKSQERQLLTLDQLERNLAGIRRQLERFLDFDAAENAVLIVNNYDWLSRWSIIDFLRDVGKHFPLGYMLAKESVRRREEIGISYTEFSYMLLQAADFLHLFQEYGCELQVGGGDQWGNITAGVELIRRSLGETAYGLTSPLITTATGVKFGKSEAGAIWLDPEWTSPYQFYQYWLNVDDRDAVRYLQYFTFLPQERIQELAGAIAEHPERREAQRVLAEEVTALVHGPEALASAQRASQMLFGGEVRGLSDQALAEVFQEAPSTTLPRARLEQGIPILDLFTETGLAASKGEARNLIRGGGAYLNNERVADEALALTPAQLASESMLVLRSGKKKYHLVRFAG